MRSTDRMQRGLALLATVGSTAPFVGLFGTVWGIYHALTAIGIAGQASIDKVAGPVGEALIMTAMGLAVAVPAVLGYNWLIRRNKIVLDRVRRFAADLIALLGGSAAAGGAERLSMAISLGTDKDDDDLVAAINTTPLVDIMLVLLIIFLITVPVVTHTVPVALPHERDQPTQTQPHDITIAIDKDGNVYWNEARVRRQCGAPRKAGGARSRRPAARDPYPRRPRRCAMKRSGKSSPIAGARESPSSPSSSSRLPAPHREVRDGDRTARTARRKRGHGQRSTPRRSST